MTHTLSASLLVGMVTGSASAFMQQSDLSSPTMSMVVPLLSAAIGAASSYAVLKTTVQTIERDVQQMRRDIGQIYDLTRDLAVKVARIEGEIERSR